MPLNPFSQVENINKQLNSQISNAPINISLTYVYNNKVMIPQHLEFPINPEELTKDIGSSSDSVEIEGLGEVSIPKTPSLSRMTIKSFFWQAKNVNPSIFYVRWLERWQKSKQPALLVVTRFDYSMKVTCEKFNYTIKAGEEDDIYFELELREYREYGVKTLASLNISENAKKQALEIAEASAEAVLVTIAPPTRMMRNFTNIIGLSGGIYKTRKNDSIISVCQKFGKKLADDWKELFNFDKMNKKIISNLMVEDSIFPEGTELIIPTNWLNGGNIINV